MEITFNDLRYRKKTPYAYMVTIGDKMSVIAQLVIGNDYVIVYPFMISEFGLTTTHGYEFYLNKEDVKIIDIFETKTDVRKYFKFSR